MFSGRTAAALVLAACLTVDGIGRGEGPPADRSAREGATKAALDDIQREAEARKAQRAEQVRLRRRVERQAGPPRSSNVPGLVLARQRWERQRRLNAASNRAPADVFARMLAPRTAIGTPAGRFQGFSFPAGGGFVMGWRR